MISYTEGELILITHEAHSDYGISGLYRATDEINVTELLQEWATEIGAEVVDGRVKQEYGTIDPDKGFVCWLVAQGWIKSVEFRELNTGMYGRTKLMDW
jgi:hypothetical protein